MPQQDRPALERLHVVFAVACLLMLAGTLGVFIQDRYGREFPRYQEAYEAAERQRLGNERRGIQQAVLDNLPVDVHFGETRRVDRCVTCHQAIDNSGPQYRAGAMPQLNPALRSHPRLELFVSADSKHPYARFGCTICHQGRPMGVAFSRAAHSPRGQQQALEWTRTYGWTPFESWERPMLPLQYTEAACLKCHRGPDDVPQADTLNAGRELFRNRGCTNCHMGAARDKDLAWVGRAGPDLRRIGEKDIQPWVRRWVANPWEFRPSTRMPRLFGLENRKDAAGAPLTIALSGRSGLCRDAVEIEAISTYLFVTAKLRELPTQVSPSGNVDSGRRLFAAVGCVACHSTRDKGGDEQFLFSTHAPDLSRIGAKVSAAWLYGWLKDPRRYWAETKMPNLRLSDAEAADIAGYLIHAMTGGARALPSELSPEEALDALITEKFAASMPRDRIAALLQDTAGLLEFPAAAKEAIGLGSLAAKVTYSAGPDGAPRDSGDGEWTEAQIVKIKDTLAADTDKARAVKAFIAGEFLIQHYGCCACHNIQGWTKAPVPCPNLAGVADKDTSKFVFGKTLSDNSIAHTTWDWLRTKVSRPRVFDVGSLDAIRPFERLRMPWFGYVAAAEPRPRAAHGTERGTYSPEKNADEGTAFGLTPLQVDKLVTHLLSLTMERIPAEMRHAPAPQEIVLDRGRRVFRELNCTACHLAGLSRGPPAAGAVTLESLKGEGIIIPHVLNLDGERGVNGTGRESQAPPSLVFEGRRVQPDWIYQYLRNVNTLRWGFTIRMPSFWDSGGSNAVYPSGRLSAAMPDGGESAAFPDDVAELAAFFLQDAGEKPFGHQPLPVSADNRKLYEEGRQIVTGSEYGCMNCHMLGRRNPPEPKYALDLANVKHRLNAPWLHRWLINPQTTYPWTNMPKDFKAPWAGCCKFAPDDPTRGIIKDDEARLKDTANKVRAVEYHLLHLGEEEIGRP